MKCSKLLACAGISMLMSLQAYAAVFAASHPDDMQLFMAASIIQDLKIDAKTIFIVGTAGDAGAGTGVGSNIYNNSFANIRRTAHLQSTRFAMSFAGKAVPVSVSSYEMHAGKTLRVQTVGKHKFYYLYLPDGNPFGTGYANTGFQSVSRLLAGSIGSITSLDSINGNAATYTLAELKATLASIIKTGMSGIPNVWLNVQDDASGTNPNDHADHRDFSKIVQAAVADIRCMNVALFADYDISNRSANQSESLVNDRYAYWGSLNAYLVNGGNPSTYDPWHNGFLREEYYRTSYGTGNCNF